VERGEPASSVASGSENEIHRHASATEHLHKHVDAEAIDLSTYQVAHARLGDAEERRGSRLRELPLGDNVAQGHHELGADTEDLRLSRTEPQIPEDIAGRPNDLECHFLALARAPSTPLQQVAQPVSRQLDLAARSLPRPLLEGVEDVNSLGKLRHVEHTMCGASVDSDLVYP
jgi:hypothetical protein